MSQRDARAMRAEHARWLERADAGLRPELEAMAGDVGALAAAFGGDLSFGTGGLRGVLGAGTGRMNVHTVARATQGLADYLNGRFCEPSVAIARDSRRMGEELCGVAASVLAANGVRALVFPRPEPTPALSFAVRELGCSAGVCVTASHNPACYSGYKVYGPDGCQVTDAAARELQGLIDRVDVLAGASTMGLDAARESGLVGEVPDEVLEAYVAACCGVTPARPCSGLKVAYTPLHGAGLECASRVLGRAGADVAVVREQAAPDGGFPTCPRPNPEEREALELGIEVMGREGCDLLLANDPDADRLAVAVPSAGAPRVLTGNEVGLLLLERLSDSVEAAGGDLSRKVAVTTIVSTPLADAIARERGFELRRTLTGFKYIGEQAGVLEREGRAGDFLLGFEESCGYLAGAHVRDKDGVQACALVCRLAARLKADGSDMARAVDGIYARYGFCRDRLVAREYGRQSGPAAARAAVGALRAGAPAEVAGLAVERVLDYSAGLEMPVVGGVGGRAQRLPGADVLELRLEGGSRVTFRPSGTEPKAKAYVSAVADTADAAEALLGRLAEEASRMLGGWR